MGMWTAIALISIASIVASIFNDKKSKRRSAQSNDELSELHAKVDKLEKELRDRVETLERIVTNPKEDLKRQFDYLDKAS